MVCFVMMDTLEGMVLAGLSSITDLESEMLLQLIRGNYLDSTQDMLPPIFYHCLQWFAQQERVPIVGIQQQAIEECRDCYEMECECPPWVPRTQELCIHCLQAQFILLHLGLTFRGNKQGHQSTWNRICFDNTNSGDTGDDGHIVELNVGARGML